MQFADKLQGFPEKAATFPNRIFRRSEDSSAENSYWWQLLAQWNQ
jgi:hypothetical protein